MMATIRRLFRPHDPIPPPPDVDLSSHEERARIEARQQNVLARLDLLRIETDVASARQVHRTMEAHQ